MEALLPFDFEDNVVRVVDRDGEPWFVLSDVCRVLDVMNTSDANRRLDDDEKDTLDNIEGIAGPQVQALTIINESGLYSLILTSRKPAAKRFKKWVTADLLPTLRRQGSYHIPERSAPIPDDPAPQPQPGAGLPDAELERLWLNKISMATRLYGRAAGRRLWELSPLEPVAAAVPARRSEGETALTTEARCCLDHLLSAPMDQSTATDALSVADGVRLALEDDDGLAAQALVEATGLRFHPAHPGCLCVPVKHPFLKAVFADSPWPRSFTDRLRALPGAVWSSTWMRCGRRGLRSPAVAIPLTAIRAA